MVAQGLLRVEFRTVNDREDACRNAFRLKDSFRFRHMISLSRDKIREDRERDRAIYLAKKLARQTVETGGNSTPLNDIRNTEVTPGTATVNIPLTIGAGSPTVAPAELRNSTVEGEQAHPQMVDQPNNP